MADRKAVMNIRCIGCAGHVRRKTAAVGTAYVCGLFLASFLSVRQAGAVMAAAAVVGAAVFLVRRPRLWLPAVSAFIVALGMYSLYTVLKYDRIIAYDGRQIEFCGEIRDISYVGNDMFSVRVRGKLGGCTTEISFLTADADVGYGDKVTLTAKVSRNCDSLNYRAESYKKAEGEFLTGGYARILSTEECSSLSGKLRRAVLDYRDHVFNVITAALPGREGSFLAAMLCGDRSELDSRTRSSLYRAGVGHIFSVSGMHLMIISSAVICVLKRLRLGIRMRFLISECVIWMFVVFAGASTSVVRAALMMTVLCSAPLFGRSYDCLTAIMLSVMLITAVNPYAIRSASLLLSAGGAFALGVAAPHAVKMIEDGRFASVKRTLAASVTVSFILTPVSLLMFDEYSVIAPLANALLIPLFTAALTLAAAVSLTGMASVAGVLLAPAGLLAKLLLWLGDRLSSLPFAYIPTGYRSVRSVALAGFVIALAWMLLFKKKRLFAVAAVYLCIVMASAADMYVLSDTLRLYVMFDENRSSCVVTAVNGAGAASVTSVSSTTGAALINLSGNGGLAPAVKRLCDSKGVAAADAYYELSGSEAAFASYSERLEVSPAGTVAEDGCAVFEQIGDALAIGFKDTFVYVGKSGAIDALADRIAEDNAFVLTETGLRFADGGVYSFPENEEAVYEIMITGDGLKLWRLDYGFVEG